MNNINNGKPETTGKVENLKRKTYKAKTMTSSPFNNSFFKRGNFNQSQPQSPEGGGGADMQLQQMLQMIMSLPPQEQQMLLSVLSQGGGHQGGHQQPSQQGHGQHGQQQHGNPQEGNSHFKMGFYKAALAHGLSPNEIDKLFAQQSK